MCIFCGDLQLGSLLPSWFKNQMYMPMLFSLSNRLDQIYSLILIIRGKYEVRNESSSPFIYVLTFLWGDNCVWCNQLCAQLSSDLFGIPYRSNKLLFKGCMLLAFRVTCLPSCSSLHIDSWPKIPFSYNLLFDWLSHPDMPQPRETNIMFLGYNYGLVWIRYHHIVHYKALIIYRTPE